MSSQQSNTTFLFGKNHADLSPTTLTSGASIRFEHGFDKVAFQVVITDVSGALLLDFIVEQPKTNGRNDTIIVRNGTQGSAEIFVTCFWNAGGSDTSHVSVEDSRVLLVEPDFVGVSFSEQDFENSDGWPGTFAQTSINVADLFENTSLYETSFESVGSWPGTNNPPTGEVLFSGTLEEYYTLTATNTLVDKDGLVDVVFSYDWYRAGDPTPVATNTVTYALQSADVDQNIYVVANYTDNKNTYESVPSEEKGPILEFSFEEFAEESFENAELWAGTQENAFPTPTFFPFSAEESFDHAETWPGAQSTPFPTPVFFPLDFEESFESEGVWPGTNRPPSGEVFIIGDLTGGNTLTASNTIVDPDGTSTSSFRYDWFRVSSTNPDAEPVLVSTDSVSYRLQPADMGQTIYVVAVYTDDGNTEESVNSAVSVPVVVGDLVNEGLITRLNADDTDSFSEESDYTTTSQDVWIDLIGADTNATFDTSLPALFKKIPNEPSYFELSGSLIRVAKDSVRNASESLTTSMWIRFSPDMDGVAKQVILHQGNDSPGNGAYGLYIEDNALHGYFAGSPSTQEVVSNLSNFERGVWHHLSFVRNWNVASSEFILSLWKNGELLATSSFPAGSFPINQDFLYIGGFSGSTPAHLGDFDLAELQIYNRVLPAEDLLHNFEQKRDDFPATGEILVGGSFEEGTTLTVSNTLQDLSGIVEPVTYEWFYVGDPSAVLSTEETYTLSSTDVGESVYVVASYTNSSGDLESVTSAEQGPITELSFETFTTLSFENSESWPGAQATTFPEPTFDTLAEESFENATTWPGAQADISPEPAFASLFEEGFDGGAWPGTNSPAEGSFSLGLYRGGGYYVGNELFLRTVNVTDADGLTDPQYTLIYKEITSGGPTPDDPVVATVVHPERLELLSAWQGKRLYATLQFTDDNGNLESVETPTSFDVEPAPVAPTFLLNSVTNNSSTNEVTLNMEVLDDGGAPSYTVYYKYSFYSGTNNAAERFVQSGIPDLETGDTFSLTIPFETLPGPKYRFQVAGGNFGTQTKGATRVYSNVVDLTVSAGSSSDLSFSDPPVLFEERFEADRYWPDTYRPGDVLGNTYLYYYDFDYKSSGGLTAIWPSGVQGAAVENDPNYVFNNTDIFGQYRRGWPISRVSGQPNPGAIQAEAYVKSTVLDGRLSPLSTSAKVSLRAVAALRPETSGNRRSWVGVTAFAGSANNFFKGVSLCFEHLGLPEGNGFFVTLRKGTELTVAQTESSSLSFGDILAAFPFGNLQVVPSYGETRKAAIRLDISAESSGNVRFNAYTVLISDNGSWNDAFGDGRTEEDTWRYFEPHLEQFASVLIPANSLDRATGRFGYTTGIQNHTNGGGWEAGETSIDYFHILMD